MKSEVYSWRAAPELLEALQRRAKAEGRSVASLLDEAAREWLKETAPSGTDDQAQERLHASVRKSVVGKISSGRSDRSTTVRRAIRDRLKRRAG